MNINIDLIIIIFFLVTTLAIGLYASRSIKTFKDYAIGNSKIPSTVIAFSLIATIYGGHWLCKKLNEYYQFNFYAFLLYLSTPFSYYITSRILILRMKEFTGHFSVAESIGSIYGPIVRTITAILGIVITFALFSIQVKIGLDIVKSLFPGIEHYSTYLTLVLVLIVVFYSSFGGAKAIAFTDVYQFLFFGLCIPVLTCMLLYRTQSTHYIENIMSISRFFSIEHIIKWDNIKILIYAYGMGWIIFPFDPAVMQRFYMVSSVERVMKIFKIGNIFHVLCAILFLSPIIALYICKDKLQLNEDILLYIIKTVSFPGIQGIIITTVFALLMSTADSSLHAASIIFTNDIWPLLDNKSKFFPKRQLTVVRITTVFMGICSIIVVKYTTSFMHVLLNAFYLYDPVITIPFVISILGFRPRGAVVLLTMSINIMVAVYRIFYKSQVITRQDIFESLIFSAFILFFLHYIFPKRPNTGWIGVPDDSPVRLQNQETKRWWLRKIKAFKAIFTACYWSTIFPKNISTFIILGIYLIIYSSISLFQIQQVYFFSSIYWYMSIMAIGTIVSLYPALHSYKKGGNKLLYILCPIILWYSLFIMGILFYKLSYYSPIVLTLYIINICISILLLPIAIVIVMLVAAIFIHLWIPLSTIALVFNKEIMTIESVLGVATVLCCLFYRYIQYETNLKLKIVELSRNYERELSLSFIHNQANWNRLDPTYSGKILEEIADNFDKKDPEEQKQRLRSFSRILLQRTKEEHTLTLDAKDLKQVDINKIIFKSYETVRNLDKPLQLLLQYETKVSHILTDLSIFERLLTINFFEICQSKQANDYILTLTIRNTSLHYYCPTYTENSINKDKRITPLTLPALAFYISTTTDHPNIEPIYNVINENISGYLPKNTSSLYQIESRQTIQSHGGYTDITETDSSLNCLYVLPVDGTQVMHLKRYHTQDLSNNIAETDSSLIQEQAFINLIKQKTTLTEQKVKETIQFLKKAHGNTLRKSGDPYYTHPIEVAKIILEINNDSTILLAALLHDTVEDSEVTLDQIELLYGRDVAYIVDMVTHYNVHGFRWKLDGQENHRLLKKCKDIRVLQIKLADRLHNLRTLSVRTPRDQVRIAKETLEFYIPWAKKNNFSTWVKEIKDICKKVLTTYDH